ncbi:flavodoxin domain-containing protein [Oscillibacter sp.]|uniref:flavodoxin domain-containing protein n=1 Tax=Oscillibacter sp. TaxID=1945593 RepID=UPI001B712FCC|nr:hypothetical protein [Oscillibacter sp.]MBP3509257.1 hypothetical protein [Oscillibacter sp.]
MEPKAIVYTSNTGYTAQYAALLAKKTGLHAYALDEALEKVPDGAAVIYMGWIMAGKIQGFITAVKHYQVAAVCGVGMNPTGSQLPMVRQANGLGENMPVFTLQGGLNMDKLHGFKKLILKIMGGTMGKQLMAKQDRTPEEDAILDMFRNGGDRVSMQNLKDVAAWYEQETGKKL